MAVTTRIDARSQRNNSIQIQDKDGKILVTIEVVGNSDKDADIAKLRNEANLRIQTAGDIQIVKASGVVLRKK